jgi:hypothetical protein
VRWLEDGRRDVRHLDDQMQAWSPRLRDDLGISLGASRALATSIAQEVNALPQHVRVAVLAATPVPLRLRLDEVRAFQAFMDEVGGLQNVPHLIRAQVIVQNYVCFVYLGDACFRVLRKQAPVGSTVGQCCRFLTDNPVRAFRNAIAHGNWRYLEDFSGLAFWSRKGDDPDENPAEYEVSQNELDFWQSLARCTAYAAYTALSAS